MSPDHVSLLADIGNALLIAFVFIPIFSTGSYQLLRWLEIRKKTDDAKLLIVAAEVLGAIGLVGLLTFAGRARMDDEEFRTSVLKAQSGAVLQRQASQLLASPICTAAGPPKKMEEVSAEGLCDFLRGYERSQSENVYWNYASHTADVLAVERLKVGDMSPGNELGSLARAIDTFENARHLLVAKQGDHYLLKIQAPWVVLLACTVLAALGISVKIARALREWKKEKKHVADQRVSAAAAAVATAASPAVTAAEPVAPASVGSNPIVQTTATGPVPVAAENEMSGRESHVDT